MQRITSYLDPWSDPLGVDFNYPIITAIGPGGYLGLDLDKVDQNFFINLNPQTDC